MGVNRWEIIKICVLLINISLSFAEGNSVLTCKTFNINIAASPVGFVPEFSCCGIIFCKQTNPNIELKF